MNWSDSFPTRPGKYWGSELIDGEYQPAVIVTFERMGGIMECTANEDDWFREDEVMHWQFWGERIERPPVESLNQKVLAATEALR